MEKIIEAESLSRHFGNFKAVDQISFHVHKGEIFGFLGANGAGKTTAMRMLCGLLQPSGGTAKVAGYDVSTQSERIKKEIGYMSQKFSLYEDLTVMENIHLFGGIYGVDKKVLQKKADLILEELQFTAQARQLVGALPLGWKQKLSFSVALLHQPAVVFLDEPTGGVDPITRRQFWDMIYKAASDGTTLFVTTHYMDEAEYCQRVSIMVDGKIAALDSPGALRTHFNANDMNEVFLQLARGAQRSEV